MESRGRDRDQATQDRPEFGDDRSPGRRRREVAARAAAAATTDRDRTEATRLLQGTGDRERLRREAQNRGQILQQGIEDLPTQAPKVEAPGFSFTEQQ